jgi:hypothetical protein
MSHIVTIKTEIRDATAVRAACQRLGLPAPVQGVTKLFSGEATGLAVQLPDWQYPVVADLASGTLRYDNFNGRWGDQAHLDRFLQAYACEKCLSEARKKGHTVSEQRLADGPAIKGLIEIDKLVFVVLFDDPDERGRSALRLAGFSGRCIPWGVRWGGPEQSKFFKNLLLQPMPGARGLRLDTTSADLLRLGLQLDRDVQRHIRYGRRFKCPQVRLPRLWAGFRAADAANITGDGPELEAYGRHTGRSPDDLLETARRSHFGLTLYPFPWVSAYTELDAWDGITCDDCGAHMGEEDRYGCCRCGSSLCEECSRCCTGCEESHCCGCLSACPECEQDFCRSCLETCPRCDRRICGQCMEDGLCTTCHEKQFQDEEQDDDDSEAINQEDLAATETERPDTPPEPHGLGKALVPA